MLTSRSVAGQMREEALRSTLRQSVMILITENVPRLGAAVKDSIQMDSIGTDAARSVSSQMAKAMNHGATTLLTSRGEFLDVMRDGRTTGTTAVIARSAQNRPVQHWDISTGPTPQINK